MAAGPGDDQALNLGGLSADVLGVVLSSVRELKDLVRAGRVCPALRLVGVSFRHVRGLRNRLLQGGRRIMPAAR